MRLHPLTQQVFSSDNRKERAFRWLCLATMVAMGWMLYRYWQPLRSPEVAYPLVSWTITNHRLEAVFRGVTALGSEGFFLTVLAMIYWCMNKTLGFWGMVFMPLSILITSEVPKDITRLPRPEVRGVSVPTYTFPSGHASGATVVWGYAAIRAQRTWFWLLSLVIITLVGLSRVTLGYHFPGDVLGGFLAGIVFLAIAVWIRLRVDMVGLSYRVPWTWRLILAFLVPFALAFLPFRAWPGLLGYCSGAAFGYLIQARYVRFRVSGSVKEYVLRGLIGLPPIAIFILGVAPLVPPNVLFLRFFPYFLTTLWITLIGPLVFSALGFMVLQPPSPLENAAKIE